MRRTSFGLLKVFLLLMILATGPALTRASAQSCSGISGIECEALQAIYDSTNGKGWDLQENKWWTLLPVGQWDGVTVENNHVVELDLSYKRLSGTLPPQIGNLAYLRALDLTGNALSGEIPGEISTLTQLEYLSFWDNNLWGEIPPGLTGLTQLSYLDLSSNYLSGTIPGNIGNLTKLGQLWLESNLLTGEIPDSISSLGNLEVLSLYKNQLQGELPAGIGSLVKLSLLLVNDNFLSGTIPGEIGNLSGLTRFTAGDNRFSGPLPLTIYNLGNLENLSLRNNLLTGQIDPGISSLYNLYALDLSGNLFTGTIPESLGNLANLESLRLNRNMLSGPIPASLGYLYFLQELFLQENQLTGTIPPQFGNYQYLVYLSLHDNHLEGEIPPIFDNMPFLKALYLTNNNLTGEIPANLGYAPSLQRLGLSNNRLEGTIPNSFSNLSLLRGLWASGNLMSGELPGFLSNPPESIDLRWNQLQSTDLNIRNRVEQKHGYRFTDTQTLQPDNFSAQAAGNAELENRVDLTWDPIAYTENDGGYEIFFKKDGDPGFTRAGITADKSVDSYTLPDLEPGADYTFKLRAITWAHSGNKNILSSPELSSAPVTTGSLSRAFIPVWKRALDRFTGIVVSNFGDTPFNVTLSAYGKSGKLENSLHNPAVRTVAPHWQVSEIGNEFFGPGSFPSDTSWVELKTENTNRMGSLFLFGVTDTSMLDGAETQTRYAKKLYFTRPLAEGLLEGFNPDIQFSVVNPFDEALSVRFVLAGEGSHLSSSEITIPGKGFIVRTTWELFGSGHGLENTYMSVETSDGPGIIGFSRIEIPGIRTALGFNAVEASQERLLYSAQMASSADIVTSVRLVNTSAETRQLRLSAIAPDGSFIAADAEMELCGGCAIENYFSELFDLPEEIITVGSLAVETDGGGIIGDVVFADGDNLKYALAMPLQTRLFTEAVFNHVASFPTTASFPGIFTGIALFNPGDTVSDIDITVYGTSGDIVASKELQLGPGQRISRTLTDPDMWPNLPIQSGGYIKIESTRPLVGQQLFGDADLRYMAAIPPTTRIEPMFDN